MVQREKTMHAHRVKQFAIAGLMAVLVLTVESISALGAWHSQSDPVRGLQLTLLTLSCAAVAYLGFGLAGTLKDDERPHVRRRAKAARFVAVCFLFLGPIPFFGSAIKMERISREYEAYLVSPAFEADSALAAQSRLTISDRTSDDWEIAEAARRTVRPTGANLTAFDIEFWAALAFQFLLIFSSDALRVPAPITQEERLALMYKQRGQKAAATRRKRKAAKETKKGFRILAGGKK